MNETYCYVAFKYTDTVRVNKMFLLYQYGYFIDCT